VDSERMLHARGEIPCSGCVVPWWLVASWSESVIGSSDTLESLLDPWGTVTCSTELLDARFDSTGVVPSITGVVPPDTAQPWGSELVVTWPVGPCNLYGTVAIIAICTLQLRQLPVAYAQVGVVGLLS
jgi:hypothetical protein